MVRLLSLLFLFVTLSGCASRHNQYVPQRGYGPDIPAMEWAMVTYGDEMEREKRLRLEDARAYYDDYIEYVWMKFSTMADMYPYEARDLVVYLVEGFLARVNENPTLSQDVYTFPFSAENLLVDIHLESFHNLYQDTRSLALIQLRGGMVYYYAADALNPDTVWYHKRSEPYEKAYRFSKYTSYRPWLPEKTDNRFIIRDVGIDDGASTGSVYRQRPLPRPQERRSNQSLDTLGPPDRLPNLGQDLPSFGNELELQNGTPSAIYQ